MTAFEIKHQIQAVLDELTESKLNDVLQFVNAVNTQSALSMESQ